MKMYARPLEIIDLIIINEMINILKRIFRFLKLGNLKYFVIDYYESVQRLRQIKTNQNIDLFKMIRISVKNSSFNEYIKLQSKGRLGLVNETIFATTLYPHINVVINNLNPYIPLISKLKENWLIHIEPPSYIQKLNYNNEKLLSKFTRVYTNDPTLYKKGGKYIASPPYVHWHLEISSYNSKRKCLKHDYDYLHSQINPPKKNTNLAIINSNINDLPGHKKRAEFIKALCEKGLDFKLYGGSNWQKYSQYVDSAQNGKWPIYSESRFVLAIENEVASYYWTEKITDAILCWSMPIYYGCPNIEDYLPQGSYINLDINADDAIIQLENIINSNYYENNINNLAEARKLILNKYNLLNFLEKELQGIHCSK